jgi:SHS family lactate transporter-like MFS transporter
VQSIVEVLWRHKVGFFHLLLLMTFMSCLSHRTQDLYPDFLKSEHALAHGAVANVAILYDLSAIAGALVFGQISERVGRRRGIMLALWVSLASVYLWAFGPSVAYLIIGSRMMQAGVQGAFGAIPAHLNELSPDALRSLFPGFIYQLGILLASPALSVEYALRDRFGYSWALALFESIVIVSLLVIFRVGPERQGRSFQKPRG